MTATAAAPASYEPLRLVADDLLQIAWFARSLDALGARLAGSRAAVRGVVGSPDVAIVDWLHAFTRRSDRELRALGHRQDPLAFARAAMFPAMDVGDLASALDGSALRLGAASSAPVSATTYSEAISTAWSATAAVLAEQETVGPGPAMLARYVLATCALCCVPCWTFAVGVRPPTRALIGAQRTYVRAMEVQIALALPRAGAAHFPAVGTRASVLLEGLGRLLSARGAALERLDRWMSAFVTARVREEERARTTLRLSADVAGQFTSVTLAPDGKVRRLADDGKYWFSKLYEIITSEEIGQRGLFWDEAYVMHFVPRFYDLYHRALLRYLRGEHDQVSQLWLTHFEVTERVDISLFAHVSQCIESGVRAHIVGDMTEALTTSFRSYVATYRLPSSDLAQHWEDFFPVNRHIFERVKARFFIDLSQQTFPGSVEAGQFAFGAADQIAGLPIDQIYGWRTAAWQQAVAGLEQ